MERLCRLAQGLGEMLLGRRTFTAVFGFAYLTWQAFASLGYPINPRWSVEGGWCYLSAEKEIEGRDVKTDFSGPLLGFRVQV